MTGVERIAAERQRQIEVEGWTAEHDRQHHQNTALIEAAICYALDATGDISQLGRGRWPWERGSWKPDTRIRDLEKAGALIAAEIDRLQSEQEVRL